jgi:glycosyltransferase involved in cell wall biosynthesis
LTTRSPAGDAAGQTLRALVVAEFYPRANDPVLGIWAHRQAVAARDAGADVRVAVLYRPIPPRAEPRALGRYLRQPPRTTLDGLTIDYVPFVSPPRAGSYGRWGAWAAPSLAAYLHTRRRSFDLIHAHNAIPAGDAARRARIGKPLVVSVHGGDVFFTAPRHGEDAVRRVFTGAAVVLANSHGIADRARDLGAAEARVVHLGTDVPEQAGRHDPHTVASLGHLVARKRHADVIRALWMLRDRLELRYLVVGDGPEREPLERLAAELEVEVEFTGQLPHEQALERVRGCAVMALPSVDEAFGVAYVEAMAGRVPAIGSIGEPGPDEIARCGDGIRLVPPGDVEALAGELHAILSEPAYLADLGERAWRTVTKHFTWEACGAATVAAYEDALQ